MQKHGLHAGGLEGIERLANAQLNLGWFVVPRVATVDFRMDGEPRGSPSPTEPCLGAAWSSGRVVTSRVEMPVAAAVERIQ